MNKKIIIILVILFASSCNSNTISNNSSNDAFLSNSSSITSDFKLKVHENDNKISYIHNNDQKEILIYDEIKFEYYFNYEIEYDINKFQFENDNQFGHLKPIAYFENEKVKVINNQKEEVSFYVTSIKGNTFIQTAYVSLANSYINKNEASTKMMTTLMGGSPSIINHLIDFNTLMPGQVLELECRSFSQHDLLVWDGSNWLVEINGVVVNVNIKSTPTYVPYIIQKEDNEMILQIQDEIQYSTFNKTLSLDNFSVVDKNYIKIDPKSLIENDIVYVSYACYPTIIDGKETYQNKNICAIYNFNPN